MSVFYQSLDYKTRVSFKRRKARFKKNKPCAICGKIYHPHEMMVAHIRPVEQLTDFEALYDIKNWQVRCIYCERTENIKKDRLKARKEKENGEDKSSSGNA